MSPASRWVRPLQALAATLGIAILALLVAWIRIDPPLPIAAGERGVVQQPAVVASALRDEAPRAEIAALPAATPSDAAFTPVAVLFGTVKRADGSSVAQGYLWLHRDGKQVGMAALRNGAYAIAGLRPGVHRLTTRSDDEIAVDRDVDVHAPATRFDIELPPRWHLHVDAVTADGKPLVDSLQTLRPTFFRWLQALAFPEPLAADLVTSGSEVEAGLGAFRSNDPIRARMEREQKALPKETIGVLTLPSDRPVHVALLLSGSVIAQMAATPGQERVTFVVGADAVLGKLGTMRFRAVDPQGAPLADAPVVISSGSGSSRGRTMRTDAEGRYVAKDLLPGRVGVGVYHATLCTPPLRAVLAPGADLDLGDITLRPGVDVEVSFAWSGGDGSVRLVWLDAPAGSSMQASDVHHFEQNGAVQKTSLFPGRYSVYARGKNGVALAELDTSALPPGPLQFDLQPGAQLRIENRIGAGFAQVEVATARGVPVHRFELGTRPGFGVELPPGDYVATVTVSGGTPQRRPFALPAGGTTLALP